MALDIIIKRLVKNEINKSQKSFPYHTFNMETTEDENSLQASIYYIPSELYRFCKQIQFDETLTLSNERANTREDIKFYAIKNKSNTLSSKQNLIVSYFSTLE